MSPLARLCVRSVWLGLSCAACGATDVVATSHKSALPCDDHDATACDAGVGAPQDAGGDADSASDAAVQSSCRPRVCSALASSDAFCRSNGSAVQVGDTCSTNRELPPQSRYALCSCTDLVSTLTFTADAFTSTLQRPAPDAADLGVNGELDLSGSGRIDGVIHVVGKSQLASTLQADAVVEATLPPCACETARLLDVAALVRAHKQNHDNAREGLSETMLDGFRGTKELNLPCGRYFFTRVKSENQLIIRARGNVAIFVESNVELNDSLQIVSEDDTSRVSVFVAGQARTGGSLSMNGDPNGKARVNLYLQGDGTLDLTGAVDITGNLYAPHAELVTTGPLQIYGSLFVRRAAFGGEVFIHRDTEAPPACN
jgi:hypothetical protein